MIQSLNTSFGVLRDGNEWVFPDGHRLPVVSGGAGEAEGTGEGEGSITVTTPPNPDPAPAKTFTQEEVTAIRRQEKDKLYAEIEKAKTDNTDSQGREAQLEAQLQVFKDEKEELTKSQEAQIKRDDAERKAREESEMTAKELLLSREDEMDTRINAVEEEWAAKFNTLQEQAQTTAAVLEAERSYQALETFKNRRVQEEQEDIMPQLVDLVVGNSEAAIEESILAAKSKTSAIMESIQEGQATLRVPRGVPTTGGSPTGPLEDHTSQQTLNAEDIRALDKDQYAQLRDQLLPQASRR